MAETGVDRALESRPRAARTAMKIALFDHVVSPHSPAGSCDVRVLQALRDEHEVTVFASELAVPDGGGRPVWHVPVPTVRRPALASFLVYFARALMSYSR